MKKKAKKKIDYFNIIKNIIFIILNTETNLILRINNYKQHFNITFDLFLITVDFF